MHHPDGLRAQFAAAAAAAAVVVTGNEPFDAERPLSKQPGWQGLSCRGAEQQRRRLHAIPVASWTIGPVAGPAASVIALVFVPVAVAVAAGDPWPAAAGG